MPPLTYEQALAFWYGRVNFEQRAAAPGDLKLDRMRALLERLGNPQERLRIVHVAGSKGKGSTSAMLASVLRRAGYRTGLFTSPHLSRVEERIQVDGEPIAGAELTSLLGEIQDVVQRWGGEGDERHSGLSQNAVRSTEYTVLGSASRQPGNEVPTPLELHYSTTPPPQHPSLTLTFFEIATAVGFLHFARRRVEVAVVEVGLGGRFDSTNVCRPLVALITSISYDHTQQLGNRLESISMEKAGIVKPGRPVVSGATAPEARQVIERICQERGAPIRQLGIDIDYRYDPGSVAIDPSGRPSFRSPYVHVTTDRRGWPGLELGLLGEHQAANATVAVACVEHLRDEGLHVPDEAVASGLADVCWPARMEVLGGRPLVVLDCAHNVASAEAVVQTLRTSFPPGRRLLVFAGSNDKDLGGMFRVLAPHFAQAFFTRFNSPRSVTPQQLAALFRESADRPFTLCPTPALAWRAALAAASPEDLICATGSVFLAGELRPLLLANRSQTEFGNQG